MGCGSTKISEEIDARKKCLKDIREVPFSVIVVKNFNRHTKLDYNLIENIMKKLKALFLKEHHVIHCYKVLKYKSELKWLEPKYQNEL